MTSAEVATQVYRTGVYAVPTHDREIGPVLLASLWRWDLPARVPALLDLHAAGEIELTSVPLAAAEASLRGRRLPGLLQASRISGPDGPFDAVLAEAVAVIAPNRDHLAQLDDWSYATGDVELRRELVALRGFRGNRKPARVQNPCAAAWHRRAGILPAAKMPTPRQWMALRYMIVESIDWPAVDRRRINLMIEHGWIEPLMVADRWTRYRVLEGGREAYRRGVLHYLRRQPPERKQGAWTDRIR